MKKPWGSPKRYTVRGINSEKVILALRFLEKERFPTQLCTVKSSERPDAQPILPRIQKSVKDCLKPWDETSAQ